RAPERLLLTKPGDEGLGASDHQKPRIAPRGRRRLDLPRVLLHRDQGPAHSRVEAAALRELVVLDTDAGGARALELAGGPHDIDGVAIAVVAVGDDRQTDRVDDAADGLEGLRERQDVRVRDGADGGDAEAARRYGVRCREPRRAQEGTRCARFS